MSHWFDLYLLRYDHVEQAYADWQTFCAWFLLVPPALAVFNYAYEHGRFRLPALPVKLLCSRGLLFASIAASLTACRYPSWLGFQLNPDEAEFLSAAHKLFYDKNFFHSVDCGTSGPLNIYPLMLPAIFGFSPDYASSRVLVLLGNLTVIYFLYRTAALLTSEALARLAILPVFAAFAVFRTPNVLHYSSEQTPIILVAAALYCSVRLLRNPAAYRTLLFALGMLVSAGFFSKMQSVPVIAAFAAVSAAYVHASGKADRFWRPSLLLAGGALPLLLLNAFLCLAQGVLKNFWMCYIVSNRAYTEMDSNFVTDLPGFLRFLIFLAEYRFFLFTFVALGIAYAVQRMRREWTGEQKTFLSLIAVSSAVLAIGIALYYPETSTVYSYLGLMIMFTVPLYFVLFYNKGSFGTDPIRWLGLLSTVSIAAALYAVYKPHRYFPHYELFFITPVGSAMLWMLIRQSEKPVSTNETIQPAGAQERVRPFARSAFAFLFVVLAVTYQTQVWGSFNDREFKFAAPTVRPPESDFIRSLTSPNGRIFVWGWTADPYLGSARVTATRDVNLFYFFLAPPAITHYYRARFMQDISKNRPEVFIDAIGPASWSMNDRNLYNFEQFPEIASFVQTNYVHLIDAYGSRYFLRKDLEAKGRSVRMPKTCTPGALRCIDLPVRASVEGSSFIGTQNLPPINMPAHALIEMEFVPGAGQTANATLFNNEAVSGSFHGFRFQTIGEDRYRLIVGLGTSWAFSKSVLLPHGKPVSLSIEFNGNDIYLRANGTGFDDMHLPSRMADAPGPITVGSWINGFCKFAGTINFFQIVDLGKT